MLDAILTPLITSPNLPHYLEQLQEFFAQETDRRKAFHRSVNEGDKVEFINGAIVTHLPIRLKDHLVGNRLLVIMNAFVQKHSLGLVGYEKLMISLSRNDYEPDLCYFRKEKSERFAPEQMRFPAPDLVVEILSESAEQRDRGIKMEDYALHGIDEYWLIDPETEIVEQYLRQGDAYDLHLKLNSGVLESQVTPGFAIPVRAIFDDEVNRQTLAEMYL